jgi:transposase
MPFAGLDLHKKMVEAVIVDDTGRLLRNDRFPATRAALESFARRHLAGCAVALEATVNTWPVAALLEPLVAEVVVSNPMRTRAIAEAKIKTDRVDAAVLAHLLRLDYLPRVWIPDAETRQLRRHTTERANLVADRTRIKTRIHAVLHQRLLEARPRATCSAPATWTGWPPCPWTRRDRNRWAGTCASWPPWSPNWRCWRKASPARPITTPASNC